MDLSLGSPMYWISNTGDSATAALSTGLFTFGLRLVAIRWNIGLPRFRAKIG